ncbi:hypothetical protein FRB90_006887 [Tulasnella sp. 427]|nr:hypothetical protein FRB90_006887 [Tulasnella sp. 427]
MSQFNRGSAGRGAPRGRGDTRGRGGGPPGGRGGAADRGGGRGAPPSRGGPPAGAGQQQQFQGGDRGRGRGSGFYGAGPRGGAPPAQRTPVATGPSAVQPTPTQVTISPNVKALGVKRRAFGTRGTSILLDTNCFDTKIPEGIIYHYSEFSPSVTNKGLKRDLFRKVQALPEFLQASGEKKGNYDGESQFFSIVSIGDECQFQLQDGRKAYTIRLKRVAELNPLLLHEYVEGKRGHESGVTAILSACNIAIRMGLMEKYSLFNRNSFFIPEAEVGRFKDRKYDGLELVRGFFQSIRPVMGRMIVNVDVSTGVVIKGGPLIQIALGFLRQTNVQALSNLIPKDKTALERFLRGFKFVTNDSPDARPGRVLPTPELHYANNSSVKPQGGSWKTGKFFIAKEVKGWVVINLSGWPNMEVPRIAEDLKRSCVAQGMRWTNNPPISFERNPMSDPEVVINEAIAEHKKRKIDPNLVLIIIPDDGKDLYYKIKHIGDVKLGIATQCLKASKCAKGGRDYSTNVSLKINAKLGGTNVVLKPADAKFLSDQPVLVLGADVMHSRAMGEEGLGRPSFAAVTGNIDMACCRYVGVGRAQRTRVEMIQDLEGMVLQIINEYKAANPGKKPFTSVVYYRDGVAENQFETVIKEELPKIRSNFFPADPSTADRTGNAPAGTVIDSVITSPVEFDFYLQPHAGLLGTSRPVHCNVLVDDNMFTPDDLQQLTFNLCHVYARSTRSVSLPAPVYYAHLVCSRANHRYDPKGNFSLDAPAPRSLQKEEAERRLQEFIKAFQPLHRNTQSVMYFQ